MIPPIPPPDAPGAPAVQLQEKGRPDHSQGRQSGGDVVRPVVQLGGGRLHGIEEDVVQAQRHGHQIGGGDIIPEEMLQTILAVVAHERLTGAGADVIHAVRVGVFGIAGIGGAGAAGHPVEIVVHAVEVHGTQIGGLLALGVVVIQQPERFHGAHAGVGKGLEGGAGGNGKAGPDGAAADDVADIAKQGNHQGSGNEGRRLIFGFTPEEAAQTGDAEGNDVIQQDNGNHGRRAGNIAQGVGTQGQLDTAVDKAAEKTPGSAVAIGNDNDRQHGAQGDGAAVGQIHDFDQAEHRGDGNQHGGQDHPLGGRVGFGRHGLHLL